MNDLIVRQPDGVVRADSRIIAERLGIEHRFFIRLIDKHKLKVESSFGFVRFENAGINTPKGVREMRIAWLTENQAEAMLTLVRNTEQAVDLKFELVKAFQEAKRRLKSPGILPTEAHKEIKTQKLMSRVVNGHNYEKGGVQMVIDYNRENCLRHTGYEPHDLKKLCKSYGFKNITSGKDAARKAMPSAACAMSLHDNLVSEGYENDKAYMVSVKSKELFALMLECGIKPAELNQ